MKRDLLKGIVSVYYATLPSNIGDLKNFNSLRSREIDLCTNAKLKLQKYQVWQLLTYAVKDVFGIDANQMDFFKSNDGKWRCDLCEFSLSHSGLVVAVALSSGLVGVDVQKARSTTQKLAQRILTPDQMAQYQTLSSTEQQKYLISNWSKRESIFKAVGGSLLSKQLLDTSLFTATKTFEYFGDEYILTVAYDGNKKIEFNDCINKQI